MILGVSRGMLGQSAVSGWPPKSGQQVLALWPKGAPDATPAAGPEADLTAPNPPLIGGRPFIPVGNVSVPTMTVFRAKGMKSGAAVVVFPGGGYSILAIDLEGTEVCDWLVAKGVTCLLVKYRVPGSGPYPKSKQALEDAQRAIGLARLHAAEWGVDSKKVGVLGFSAGGHLAAAVSTHFGARLYGAVDAADEMSCRPDFTVLVYPAYLTDDGPKFELVGDLPVTKETPPAFMVQTADDPVYVESSVAYFLALKRVGVAAEAHLYAEGRHGYGLRKTKLVVTEWPGLVERWLKGLGMVP
jgi:acetyl esterase/lipase